MGGKDTARPRRPHAAPKVVAPQNRVNVALPLSVIKAEEPVTMRPGDWISLAGLVVSAIGFSVVIRELIRIAHTPPPGKLGTQLGAGTERTEPEGTGSLPGR